MNLNSIAIFFNLLKSCYDGALIYPDGNPIVDLQFKNFLATYQKFLDNNGQMVVLAQDGYVKVNGHPLPLNDARSSSVIWFLSQCEDRWMVRTVFNANLRMKDVKGWVSLFHRQPMEFTDEKCAADFLAETGASGIEINGDMATSLSNDELEFDLAAPTINNFDAVTTTHTAKLSGEFAINTSVPESQLFISEEDRKTLLETVNDLIFEGQLKRVAEILTLIRNDLVEPSLDDRQVAFSSYQVVVLSLIGGSQHSSLLSILRSMPNDFLACKEEDLFALHLQTLSFIVTFFDQKSNLGGFLLGLDIIANQSLRLSGPFRQMMEDKACEFLDLNHLTNILRCVDPTLQPLMKSLLANHGSGLLKPLLAALFESDDRNIRKRILEVLHRQGPIIYPNLLFKLESAIKQGAPWYVKRNLLTLLSIKPPVDLAPLLQPLYREKNNKMRELTCRCLFQIAHEKAYKLGKVILRETDEAHLGKVLDYVHVGKDPIYATDVFAIFNRVSVEKLKMMAISILGKMASEASINFLGGILGNVSRFGGEKPEARLAAARALINSHSPKALTFLLKHKRDPDKAIKAQIKQALTRVDP